MTASQFVIELSGKLAWPLTILCVLWVFRQPVIDFLERTRRLKINLPGGSSLVLTAAEAEEYLQDVLQDVLREIDQYAEEVPERERDLLRKIRQGGGSMIVSDLVPDFRRSVGQQHNPGHELLRRLRSRHLIRPAEGGPWTAAKHVTITPFGQLVLKLRGKELLGRPQD